MKIKSSRTTAACFLVASGLVGTGLVAGAPPALAHGKLEATTPADAAMLAALPDEIVVRFDTPHRVTLLQIAPADGAPVRLTTREGLAPSSVVTAGTPALEAGEYRLEWRALAPDGHAMRGSTTFTYAPD